MRQLATKGDASFWVVLRGSADLTAAAGMHNRSRRGVAVYDGLTSFANQSQAPLRAWLDARNIRYQPYWIVNAIFVKSADEAQLDAIAARPDVKLIRANHSYAIPKETVDSLEGEPLHDRVGPERDQRAPGLVDLQRPRRGDRHLQHRHGRARLARGARRPVPRATRRR